MPSISLLTSIPGPNSELLAARRARAVPRAVVQITPIFVRSASGAMIEDVDGNRLLDLAGGIGCVNAGHANPAVTEAIRQQSAQFLHTCFMVAPYESYVRLAERLNELAPGPSEKRTFFVNSGAEAVENAVKIARSYTQRPGIVAFADAFHGRTYMAMSLTSKSVPYKEGFGPFAENVYRIPYPDPYHRDPSGEIGDCVDRSLRALEHLFRTSAPAESIAAIIIEPVLGEGGFIVPPAPFFPRLREICDRHGILLIADEVQSGFGRTGKMFACEHFGIEPDLLLLAKSIASGMPLAAITGKAEIMNDPGEGALGGTFGGNPVCCEAALATLDLFETGDLCHRARKIGDTFRNRALEWQSRYPYIGDVRGLGAMQAFELVHDPVSQEPNAAAAQWITRYAYQHGVILLTAGSHSNVVRLLVPLVISDEDLSEGLNIIEEGITDYCTKSSAECLAPAAPAD
jgi:4-aminobutyrate aminotransferase / (S)-3-amino-2-methylpropionate transaminase / 5-aminovalerate transaminase